MNPTLQQFTQLSEQVRSLSQRLAALETVFRNHRHKGSDGSTAIGFRDLVDAPKAYIANDYVRVTGDANGLHLSAT